MSSSLRRGALAATALVLSIAPLSACAAGNSAQTLQVKPDNAETSVGDIKLQNINVITQPEQSANGPAVVTGKIFNNGRTDQQLRSISFPGKNVTVNLSPAKGAGALVVPAGGSLTLGGKDNASAVLPKGREGFKDGDSQQVAFDFSNTGEVKVGAFVYPAKSFFKDWGPSNPAPAASQSSQPGQQQPGQQQSAKPGQPGQQAGAKPGSSESPQAGQHAQH
ncbi:DUF461 domain-containing protein [Streptomyces morookaense]|uniref:DUF461 domain-containing protein n=1 Tax=Streptomyces morookaense TaxID=1970 RepID=A0A7Y7B2B7_STRMO|nr:DUF461 domain-containing protein [Streptomyces morookaense]NVK77336.1 DUF461 domain-containing protein [Streptomyces morookaense]GHF18477.1 hypothetical protein GCM10010359_20200 [Streptomyces morookaense]